MLRPADYVVVALAFAAVGASAVLMWRPSAPATRLEIHGPEGVRHAALDHAQTVRITGARGTSVIEIADGRARFVSGPCRNKVCIATGWLEHRDDFAACVPNGVSVRLVGKGPGFDAINH